MKSTFLLVSGVNDTADHKSDPEFTPIFFCMNIVDIVKYNLLMYDFSIGIPFKSSQSMLNFEVLWSAVSLTPPTSG
jgi:hypothetical protein